MKLEEFRRMLSGEVDPEVQGDERPLLRAGASGPPIIMVTDAKAEYGDGRVPRYALTVRINNGREIVFEIPSSVDMGALREKMSQIRGTEFFGDDQLAALLGLRIVRSSGGTIEERDELTFRREYLGTFPTAFTLPKGVEVGDFPELSPKERARFARVGLPYRSDEIFVKLDPSSTVFGPPTTPDDLPKALGDIEALAKIAELAKIATDKDDEPKKG